MSMHPAASGELYVEGMRRVVDSKGQKVEK
jgi:hypothetical protein